MGTAYAQVPMDGNSVPPASNQLVVPAAGGGMSASQYASPPGPFQRGNMFPLRPDHPTKSVTIAPNIGYYFAIWKLVLAVAIFAFWIHYSNWVHEDARGLRVRPEFWNSTMLSGGAFGVLLLFLIPLFGAGFPVTALAIGLPLGLYVRERNAVVPEKRRVMTPAHIRSWTKRQLARIGIHIGGRGKAEKASGPQIKFIGKTKTGQRDDSRSRQVESSRGYVAAKELVYDGIMRRATDVHLEPKDGELAVRLRIDGVMYPAEPFDKAIGESIVNIFKVLCAMDITERRRPQDGSFGAIVEEREVDFRVASQGTRHGEKLSMRILDQSNSVSTIKQLGMRKAVQRTLEQVIDQPHGLLLACGPTGAGKSTTLYAGINNLDAYEKNIITIEDPIEYKMDNVTQIEINTKSGQTFAKSLRSILRQDPDVVMIGEIRDEETAKIACQAANTGHMVFSTIHANDTITALYRMIDLGVEPFMISTSISAILAQRLTRRLCSQCKESYRPSAELLKKVGLPPDKVKEFFRPPKEGNVCTECGGLGFRGRIGVYELLSVNDRMRDLVRDKAAMSAIRNEARKDGMLYMHEEGLRLVVRGVTSIDEIRRVVK